MFILGFRSNNYKMFKNKPNNKEQKKCIDTHKMMFRIQINYDKHQNKRK